jgi:phosphoribosylanthranilate isomerase
VLVKICGITDPGDAEMALAFGADELGFVLAPSPRRIEPDTVKDIIEALRGRGGARPFRAIGVFVNERAEAMRDIIAFCGLDAAQVHGDESPEDCADFDFPWFRALRIGSEAEACSLAGRLWGCPRILVDARSPVGYGGTGISAPEDAARAAGALARIRGAQFFLAGGLGPENVARVVRALEPDGIDVSSGVEEAPGKKSAAKLEALFAELREAVERGEAIAPGEETEDARTAR